MTVYSANPTKMARIRIQTAALKLKLAELEDFLPCSWLVRIPLFSKEEQSGLDVKQKGRAASQKDLEFNAGGTISGSKIVEESGAGIAINSTQ